MEAGKRASKNRAVKMKDIIVVKKAQYLDGYRLALTFSDGVKAEIDFSGWIEKYPFFEPLKDINFLRVFPSTGGRSSGQTERTLRRKPFTKLL